MLSTHQFRVSVKSFMLVCFLILLVFTAIPGLPLHAYTLPDTGQTKCYENTKEIPCPQPGEAFCGQDAQYQGPPMAYRDIMTRSLATVNGLLSLADKGGIQ
jgi:hypothetical protein